MADADTMPTLRSGVGRSLAGEDVRNLSRDQATVVELLWRVDSSEGGQRNEPERATLLLLVGPDGNCPNNVVRVIENFQTVRAARGDGLRVTGTMVPSGTSFMVLSALARSIMPQIYACAPAAKKRQEAASSALALAMRLLTDKIAPEESALAFGLVDRFFKIRAGRTEQQQKADIAGIQKVFASMSDFLATVVKDKTYFHEAPGDQQSANAYTHCGIWADRKPENGVWFVKSNCRGKSEAFLVDAIMHECAHFCGGKEGEVWCVKGDVYGDNALPLPREQSLLNAANYAWFAGTAELPALQWKAGLYTAV